MDNIIHNKMQGNENKGLKKKNIQEYRYQQISLNFTMADLQELKATYIMNCL